MAVPTILIQGLDVSTEFAPATALYNCVVSLDSSTFVIAYGDTTNNLGKAVVGTLDGVTPSVDESDAVTFEAGPGLIRYVDIMKVNATTVVISYWYNPSGVGDNEIRVIVGTISGTTITFGSPTTIKSGVATVASRIIALDDTYFVVAYKWTDDDIYCVPCSISGTTITVGTEAGTGAVITGGLIYELSALNSTDFVMAYSEGNAPTDRAYAEIGVVDTGTLTITYGTIATISSSRAFFVKVITFDENYFCLVEAPSAVDADATYSHICQVSHVDHSITVKSSQTVDQTAVGAYSNCLFKINSTRCMFIHEQQLGLASAKIGYIAEGVLSGTNLSWEISVDPSSNGIKFWSDTLNYINATMMNADSFVIVFTKGSDNTGQIMGGLIQIADTNTQCNPNIII